MRKAENETHKNGEVYSNGRLDGVHTHKRVISMRKKRKEAHLKWVEYFFSGISKYDMYTKQTSEIYIYLSKRKVYVFFFLVSFSFSFRLKNV